MEYENLRCPGLMIKVHESRYQHQTSCNFESLNCQSRSNFGVRKQNRESSDGSERENT